MLPYRYPYLFTDWGGESGSSEVLLVTVSTMRPFDLDRVMRSWWNRVRKDLDLLASCFDHLAAVVCPRDLPEYTQLALELSAAFAKAAVDTECHTKEIASAMGMVGADHHPQPLICSDGLCRPATLTTKNGKLRDYEGCARKPFQEFLDAASGHVLRAERLRHGRSTPVHGPLLPKYGYPTDRKNRLRADVLGAFRYFALGEKPTGPATQKLVKSCLQGLGLTSNLSGIPFGGPFEAGFRGARVSWDERPETALTLVMDCLLDRAARSLTDLSSALTEGAESSELRFTVLEVPRESHEGRFKEFLPSLLARHLYHSVNWGETATSCVDGQLDAAPRVLTIANERWKNDATGGTAAAISGLVPVNSVGTPAIWLADLIAFTIRNLNQLLRDPARPNAAPTIFTRIGHDLATNEAWVAPRSPVAVRLAETSSVEVNACVHCRNGRSHHQKGGALNPRTIAMSRYLQEPWPSARLRWEHEDSQYYQ